MNNNINIRHNYYIYIKKKTKKHHENHQLNSDPPYLFTVHYVVNLVKNAPSAEGLRPGAVKRNFIISKNL